jgi:DNA modification methylase
MILQADARHIPLRDNSVQCCVTSPPYWGLRDYGVTGQLGLERTPEEYVAHMVAVFREVKRVLREDGTCWVNMGDCYAAAGGDRKNGSQGSTSCVGHTAPESNPDKRNRPHEIGLKPKDLVGIPWRLAFALQADGWYLRSDIIWAKPNPMPESVTDRPTKSHEYIFLLTKSAKYYFDQEAVREVVADSQIGRIRTDVIGGSSWKERQQHGQGGTYITGRNNGLQVALFGEYRIREGEEIPSGTTLHEGSKMARQDEPSTGELVGRNLRSVWSIATAPYPEAHFATFPPEIPKRCILAGTKSGDVVLDPFAGSGTTIAVAESLGRRGVGLELKPEYIELAKKRCQVTLGLPF